MSRYKFASIVDMPPQVCMATSRRTHCVLASLALCLSRIFVKASMRELGAIFLVIAFPLACFARSADAFGNELVNVAVEPADRTCAETDRRFELAAFDECVDCAAR